MDTKMSALKGVDRTWHLNWLQMRETGQRLPLGYGNKFSKCLYSSMVPHTCWEQGGSIRGVHHGGVFNLEFSPDGSLLVAACEKRSFLMFDALSQKQVHAVENAHRDCVNCVRFLDSRTFVTCSDDSTVALWDARNLKSSIRTLHGHSNWVKNIEYSQNDGLLVTSGFDGSIYTWDINSYTENGFNYERVFHTNGLMRTRLTPDASKMIICTTGGYLMIIHDLDLHTLAQDLNGFKPNMYRLMQQSQTTIPAASVFTSLFSKKRKRNRIEFVTDFPTHNDPEVVSSLQIHPQGWCALSRNISHEELSEWTCVHDIQDRDDYDSMTDNEELPGYMRDDNDDVVYDEYDTSNNPRGFRGFPNPNYNSESDSDADSDSDWPAGRRLPVSRGTSRANLRNIPPPEVDGTDSSSSTDSESINPRRPHAPQNGSPRAPVGRRPANRTGGQGDEVNSNPVHRRGGNIRRLRITVDGQVQMSDDDSSGEPASNVRVVDAQESTRSSGTSRLSGSRPRPRFSLRSSPSTSHSARAYHADSSRYNALRRLSSLEGSSAAHPSSSSGRDTSASLADSASSFSALQSARSSEQSERPLLIPPSRVSPRSNNSPQSTSQRHVSSISSSSSSEVQSTLRRTDQRAPQEVSAVVAPSSSQSRIQIAPPGSPPSDLHDPAQARPRPAASSSNAGANADAYEDANASANEDTFEDSNEDANAVANPGANAGPNETANAAAAVGAARQARGGQGNIPLSQNMELHVASADVWEALVVIREARARRQQVPPRNLNSSRDRRDLISRFLRRLHDLNEPRQPSQAITPGSSTSSSSSSSSSSSATNNSNAATTANSTASGNSPPEAGASSARPDRPRLLRIARARQSTRQGQAPAAIALGHFLRNPTPATRTLVMIAPHQGGAQNIHLRVSPNSYSYQSQQLKIPRNHKIHQNMPRLSHYIEEPNVGKGFIKELCFSSDGRVMCSPFSYGIRLLSFTPDCQEISTSLPTDPPVRLYEVSERMCHEDYVVSSKFSPTHCLLVSGCLKGKIVWHQPNL